MSTAAAADATVATPAIPDSDSTAAAASAAAADSTAQDDFEAAATPDQSEAVDALRLLFDQK